MFSDGTIYHIEYRDIEVVSWYNFIAIITPQTKSIFHTTLSHQHVGKCRRQNRQSCSVAGAGKVTLIGSNCPASRVGRCVDCEGGRTAQIFSDCAITKHLSHATTRWPRGRQTAVPCGCQTIAARTL